MSRWEELLALLRQMGSAAVAFSAGVDSTLLLHAARTALGKDCAAVTIRSPFVPARELEQAAAFCAAEGVRHVILDVDPLRLEQVAANSPERCYHCKRALFTRIRAAAEELGLAWVLEGSNADDLGDYRPGMRAVRELGIRSPLLELGLCKDEIRAISRREGLPTWDKPAMACLATRFVTGQPLQRQALRQVEQAEDLLAGLGFTQLRVRVHGELVRLELDPAGLDRLREPALRAEIDEALRALGYRYVTADLRGYRTGSMNRSADTK